MVEYRIEVDNEELVERMRRWERDMPGFTKLLLQRFSTKLTANAQEKAGDVLNVITGRLIGSIFGEVIGDDKLEVGAGSNVKYARIHEFGGVIKFRNRVKQVEIPARPYVKPSIETFFRSGQSDDIARGAFNEYKRRYGFE